MAIGCDILCFSYLAPPALTAEAIVAGKHLSLASHFFDITLVTSAKAPEREDPMLADYTASLSVRRVWNLRTYHDIVWRACWRLQGREDEGWSRLASQECSDARVVWSRSTPAASHIAAMYWRERHRRSDARWVAQFSDPWAAHSRSRLPRRVERMRRLQEAQVCQQADALVFPCGEMESLYVARYPEISGKTHVIPHSIDPSGYGEPRPRTERRPQLAYVGSLYTGHTLEVMMQCCSGLDVDLKIVGGVSLSEMDMRRHKPLNVIATGPLPYRESLHAMASSDLLLFVDPELDRPAQHVASPFLSTKLIDYLGSRVPIAGIVRNGSSSERILSQYGFPIADVSGAAQLLKGALRDSNQLRDQARSNDYSPFEPPAVARALRSMFEQLGLTARVGSEFGRR